MNLINPTNCYIKFIQHNVNRQDAALHSILQQALTTFTDVVLLQEPYCFSNKAGGFGALTHPSFHLVTPQPSSSPSDIRIRPRVLTYIRKTCNVEFNPRYDICSDPDMQIIEFTGREPFYVMNIYNEKERIPDSSNSEYTVQRLLQHIKPDKPAIIAGDFNLHHPWWNCTASPNKASKATTLVNWLDSIKATLLINSEEISLKGGTYSRPDLKSISIIDLAFYTDFQKLVWGNWSYIEYTGSDHEAITFQAEIAEPLFLLTATNTDSMKPNYNYKKANWDQFSTLLKAAENTLLQDLDTAIEAKNHNLVAETLIAAIREAAE
jgi:exonuclease III